MGKKYNEFWNDKELEISSNDNEDKKNKKKTMPRKKAEPIEKEKMVDTIQEINIQPTIISVPSAQTLKQIYQQYIIDGTPYKIYSKGLIIFDSASYKSNPEFYDDYFILFGNKYIYKGIRFEKY